MRFAFIAEKRVAHPIAESYLDEPETERDRRDAILAAKTRAVFAEHEGRYGSPRVCRELRERGDVVSEKKVAQVMRENGLVARRKKKFRATTDSKHADPIAPDLLTRDLFPESAGSAADFSASGPNEVWVTDVQRAPTSRPPA